jgi:hypothetical protein
MRGESFWQELVGVGMRNILARRPAELTFHVGQEGLCQRRMDPEGREKRKPYIKAKFKKILTSRQIYLFGLLYV